MNRSFSLKRHKEFRYTYRVGKSFSSHLFSLVWANNRSDTVKIGFSVSKKVGNSVQRNRAKRRLRSCITPMIESIKKGTNLIFVAKPDVLNIPFHEMQNQMLNLLKKAGIYEDKK